MAFGVQSNDRQVLKNKEHSGAYGMGVGYANTMVHKAPEREGHGETVSPNPAA